MTLDGNRHIVVRNENVFSTVVAGAHPKRTIVQPNSDPSEGHSLNNRLLAFIRRYCLDGKVAKSPNVFCSCISVSIVDGTARHEETNEGNRDNVLCTIYEALHVFLGVVRTATDCRASS